MEKFEMCHFVLGRYMFQVSTKGGEVNFVPDFIGPVVFVLKKVTEVASVGMESQIRIEVTIISRMVDRD